MRSSDHPDVNFGLTEVSRGFREGLARLPLVIEC